MPPFFVGVPSPRGEPLGDHDDQKGAAIEAPVGEEEEALSPPPFLLVEEGGAADGAEGAEGAAAPPPLEGIAAAGARGRAVAAAALRTQALRKKRTAAAAASTARPTPIQAPMDSEGLLLSEAAFGVFFGFEGGKCDAAARLEKTSAGRGKKQKKASSPRHCPPALPREQPKTPPAAAAVSVPDEMTEMPEVGRPRAVSSACDDF